MVLVRRTRGSPWGVGDAAPPTGHGSGAEKQIRCSHRQLSALCSSWLRSFNVGIRMYKCGERAFTHKIIGVFVFATMLGCLPGWAKTQAGPGTKFGGWEMQCTSLPTAKTPLCALTQV